MHIIGKLGLGIMSKKMASNHKRTRGKKYFTFVFSILWVIVHGFIILLLNLISYHSLHIYLMDFYLKKKCVFIHTFENNCKIRTSTLKKLIFVVKL